MAFEKNFEMETGVIGNYWRLDVLHIYRWAGEMVAEVTISLYKDKPASDAGKQPLSRGKYQYTKKYSLPAGENLGIAAIKAGIYNDLKNTKVNGQNQEDAPYFGDAVEV